MLISVFLVCKTTLIKFRSSFSPKARNNLPIIDGIIEDTFLLHSYRFSPKFERKKFQTFTFLRLSFKIRLCSGDSWDSVIVPKIIVAMEKNNAKETIDEMQSAVNRLLTRKCELKK